MASRAGRAGRRAASEATWCRSDRQEPKGRAAPSHPAKGTDSTNVPPSDSSIDTFGGTSTAERDESTVPTFAGDLQTARGGRGRGVVRGRR